jgi:hypothetical protein
MPTVIDQQTELQAFHCFIGRSLQNGASGLTVDNSVAEFRAYQEELERCREAIRPALEASLRGESKPFDVNEVMQVVERRLAQQGVPK